jgi:hypothetical protein
MNTLIELKEKLEATGYPVSYFHFLESENESLPEPPFVVYLITETENFKADNRVFKTIHNVDVELYTNRKDFEAEAKIEQALNELNMPFDSVETYIESEQLFQKIYEIRVI